MKTAAHLIHHAKFEYNINKKILQEIEFFRDKLLPESNIVWEISYCAHHTLDANIHVLWQ
jgi:hypothetical protein